MPDQGRIMLDKVTAQLIHWADIIWPILSSELAMKFYALALGALVLAGSIYIAYRVMNDLRKIELDEFGYTQRGRKGRSPEAIARLKKRIQEHRAGRWRFFLIRFAALLVFGFLVPSVVLYLGGEFYAWFDPHSVAFIGIDTGQAVVSPSNSVLTAFVFNQMTHGALMDFLEVFDIQFGAITNAPDNYVFSAGVLAYRTFVGSFSVVLFLFVRKTALVLWKLDAVEKLLPRQEQTSTV